MANLHTYELSPVESVPQQDRRSLRPSSSRANLTIMPPTGLEVSRVNELLADPNARRHMRQMIAHTTRLTSVAALEPVPDSNETVWQVTSSERTEKSSTQLMQSISVIKSIIEAYGAGEDIAQSTQQARTALFEQN